MFRNVAGVQEAVIHTQSEKSLSHDTDAMKLIKDAQADEAAKNYSILKAQWIHRREELIEDLKKLKQHHALPNEIRRINSLIECFNELIENGEITKNCQALMNDKHFNIQLLPKTCELERKPLGDKAIQLPRHISKTRTDLSNPLEKLSANILHMQQSYEKLSNQVGHHVGAEEEEVKNTFHHDQMKTTDAHNYEKVQHGMHFFIIAEEFSRQTSNDGVNNKKRYISSPIIE